MQTPPNPRSTIINSVPEMGLHPSYRWHPTEWRVPISSHSILKERHYNQTGYGKNVLMVDDGGTMQENDVLNSSPAITMASTTSPICKSPALVVILHAVKKATIQQGRKGTYSQNIGRTLWWLATEVTVK
jgi:hypothetical protein